MILARLIEVAIDHFGRLGFEGASTRDIAKASGTAMSSITYHFGGKEGLYLAAAEHIAEAISERQKDPLAAARMAAEEGDRASAIAALLGILDRFAGIMLSPESEAWARFIIREQQAPTEAFERLYQGAMRPIADTAVILLARARSDLSDPERRATAVMLMGQAMILRAGRAAACRILQTDRLGDAEAELLRARLRANALCILEEKVE